MTHLRHRSPEFAVRHTAHFCYRMWYAAALGLRGAHETARIHHVLGGTTAAWPLGAHAQQRDTMRRIRIFCAPPRNGNSMHFLPRLPSTAMCRGGLMVRQWGDGNVAQLPELAAALKNEALDVIVPARRTGSRIDTLLY